MKRSHWILGLARATTLRTLAAGCAVATAIGAITAGSADAKPSGVLYVQQTTAGTLRKTDGTWHLTFNHPDLQTTTFTDRPARSGATIPLARLVRSWTTMFGDDAPNAALVISGAPPQPRRPAAETVATPL